MRDRILIDREEVALRLGHRLDWFYNNYEKLHAEKGFPAPVLGNKSGARWDPRAIDRWLDAQDTTLRAQADLKQAVADTLADETAELMRRALDPVTNGVRARHA